MGAPPSAGGFMITVISGTNRPGSNTRKIAVLIEKMIRETGHRAALLDLGAIPDDVWFWMRKQGGLFSSDWRVYRYYNGGDFNTPVWQKLKDRPVILE